MKHSIESYKFSLSILEKIKNYMMNLLRSQMSKILDHQQREWSIYKYMEIKMIVNYQLFIEENFLETNES